jgi:sterol 14alpha-demethylase
MLPVPPVLPGAPLLGHILPFMRNRQQFIKEAYQELGAIFTIRLGPRPVVVMIGPEYQQYFFQETDKSLSIDKPYENLKALFGEVAFLASKEVYQEQRPILHSPFQREKMIKYQVIMQREVQKWLDSLGEAGEIDISAEMSRLVQNVAGHALMGEEFQNQVGRKFWEYYNTLGESLDMVMPHSWPTPKNLRREWAKRGMRRILKPIIEQRRLNPAAHDDFLQDFMETPAKSGRQATEEEIFGLLRALMFASHETTAGQAAWTVIEILRHPEYQSRLQAEVEAFFPAGAELDGGTLRKLEHIFWAVREVERLHPSADMLMRVAEEDLEICGYRIPKGSYLLVAPSVAHRLPGLFNDPESFDPLRFAPERAEDRRHRFALIGFGGGAHKCAGMNFANNEMMTITALLFQQFELQLLTPNPGISYGLGAVRPQPTRLAYRRKYS